MSRLTQENFKKIIEYNRQVVYRLPDKRVYAAINHYVQQNTRETLLRVLRFLSAREALMIEHKYVFFLTYSTMKKKVNPKNKTERSLNKYMCMLCCIGFFKKLDTKTIRKTDIYKNFMTNNPDAKNVIGFYSLCRWTNKELKQMEARAQRLQDAKVTLKNLSHDYLKENISQAFAEQCYPWNNPNAYRAKEELYKYILNCMHWIIGEYGYCTKDMIYEYACSDEEDFDMIEKTLSVYSQRLKEQFIFKRPSKEEIEKYDLTSHRFIYLYRENEEKSSFK